MLLIKLRPQKTVFSYEEQEAIAMHNAVHCKECFVNLFRLSFSINITLQNNGQSFAVDKAT